MIDWLEQDEGFHGRVERFLKAADAYRGPTSTIDLAAIDNARWFAACVMAGNARPGAIAMMGRHVFRAVAEAFPDSHGGTHATGLWIVDGVHFVDVGTVRQLGDGRPSGKGAFFADDAAWVVPSDFWTSDDPEVIGHFLLAKRVAS